MLDGTPGVWPREVDRARIAERIGDAALVLVRADPGLGKSTAVAQVVRASSRRGVWIDASRHDGVESLRRFLRGRAGTREGPPTSPAQPPRSGPRSDAWTDVVVDSSEVVPTDVLRELVAEVGGGEPTRLVLISNRRLDGLDDLTDEREHVVLTNDDLVLSSQEFAELLRSAHIRPSAASVGFLRDAVGGIVALAAVVARTLAGEAIVGDTPSADQAGRLMVAFEAASGLPSSPLVSDPRLPIVRAAAVLGDATSREVAVLFGVEPDEARAALDAAERAGWGAYRRVEGGDRFYFDPVTARAVAFRLVVKRTRPVLARAARILSDRGEGMRALMLAFDAEDDDLIPWLASRHSGDVIRQAPDVLVRLQSIPRRRVVEHPLIAFAIAMCLAQDPRSRIAMLMNFARAERLSRPGAPHGRAVDRVSLQLARSIALAQLGMHTSGYASIRAAIAAFEELPVEEASELIASPAVLYTHGASVALSLGDVRSARDLVGRATGVPKASEMIRRHALALSALMAAVDGDVAAAEHHLDSASRRPGAEDVGYLQAISGLVRGIVAVECGDPAAARSIIAELVPGIRTSSLWPVAEAVHALAEALDGRPERAAARLRSALDITDALTMSRSDRRAIGALLALARLAHGDLAGARQAAASLGRSGGSALTKATIALVEGDPLTVVTTTTRGMTDERTIRTRAGLLLLRGAAAIRLGRRTAAQRDVDTAVDLLRAAATRLPWLLLPAEDRRAVLALAATASGRDDLLEDVEALPVIFGVVRPIPHLTGRERVVLDGVTARETNAEIAERLGVSPNTVKKQRASLYRKLGVNTWEDAVGVALDRGLLDPPA